MHPRGVPPHRWSLYIRKLLLFIELRYELLYDVKYAYKTKPARLRAR